MVKLLGRCALFVAIVGTMLVFLSTPALAQDEVPNFGDLAPVVAFLVGAVVAFGPGARGITWIVDRVRDAVPFGDDPGKKILWPLLGFAIALLACVGFGVNVVGALFVEIPRFAESTALNGLAGEIVTAVALAGVASSWHDRDKAKSGA